MLTGRGVKYCINRPNTHWKRRSVAKRNYSDKLRIQFYSSHSASVWKGLKEITNYKTPSPGTVENQQQADNLNEFDCRFEKNTPHPLWTPLHITISTSSNTLSPTPAIQISKNEVCQVFRKQKRKKAPGLDGVTPTPSSQRSLTDRWNCAKTLHASHAPPSSPSQRNPKL